MEASLEKPRQSLAIRIAKLANSKVKLEKLANEVGNLIRHFHMVSNYHFKFSFAALLLRSPECMTFCCYFVLILVNYFCSFQKISLDGKHIGESQREREREGDGREKSKTWKNDNFDEQFYSSEYVCSQFVVTMMYIVKWRLLGQRALIAVHSACREARIRRESVDHSRLQIA